MNRVTTVSALVLIAGAVACASPPATPSIAAETPAPLAAEPCDSAILEQAVAAITEVDGYRFTQEISWPQAPRRAGDERTWTRTRTNGAFLAPDRYTEEVVQTDDRLGSGTGFLRAVRIGDTQWWLVPGGDDGDAQWREVPADAHGGNVLTVVPAYLDGADVEAQPAADHPSSLPGEGGCVMTARVGASDRPGVVAVRIDPRVPRVVAFAVENDETCWRMAVTYEPPAPDEFVAPRDVAPDP